MKVIVQIPCLNEEQTLPLVLERIPKKIPGVDVVEVLIIDDGSADDTIKVARKYGVKHFVRHATRQGLARAFHDGVNHALELGADIVVNTDGDNQYPSEAIGELVRPILEGRADIVIANRQTDRIAHFSAGKKLFQKVGTRVLNFAGGTDVPDAPSGFRAYSKEALIRLNIVTRFSYAMETLIQAGNKRLAIASVPIITNPKTRESRLFKSSWEHIRKSGSAIVRAFIMYKPYVLFTSLGLFFLVLGLIPFLRYLFLWIFDPSHGAGHVQSLLAGGILLIAAFTTFTLGVVADLIRINRILIEDSLEHIKRERFKK